MFSIGIVVGFVLFPLLLALLIVSTSKALETKDRPLPPMAQPPRIENHYHYHAAPQAQPQTWRILEDKPKKKVKT